MQTKTLKIISRAMILLVIIMMVLSTVFNVYAVTTPGGVKPGDETAFDNLGNKIVGIITSIGMFVSIAVLVILGIKYMMGSTEEKAEYKKTMLPYLVGAAIVFGASGIANWIYTNFKNVVS